MRPSRFGPALFILAVGAACSSTSPTAGAIPITATNTECKVGQTTFGAGRYKFEVQNTGSDVTEVYIYGKGDKILSEKENIGPGTTATFSATLSAGEYQVACKPGQKGDGIRQTISVT
jgi:iron uptake system component EfeO